MRKKDYSKKYRFLYITTLSLIMVILSGIAIVRYNTDLYRTDINPVFAATFDSDLIPSSTDMFDIGRSVTRWKDAFFLGNLFIDGSISIGTDTTYPSSILTLESTTKGFLLPRMTTAEKDAIVSPVTGLMVFDSTLNRRQYYDGTRWKSIDGQDDDWVISGDDIYSGNSESVGVGILPPTLPAAKLHVNEVQTFGANIHPIDTNTERLVLIEDRGLAPALQIASYPEAIVLIATSSEIVFSAVDTTQSINKNWFANINYGGFQIGYVTSTADGWDINEGSNPFRENTHFGISTRGDMGIGVNNVPPSNVTPRLTINGNEDQGTLTLGGDAAGCLRMHDSDGDGGFTYCTTLNGVLTCQASFIVGCF